MDNNRPMKQALQVLGNKTWQNQDIDGRKTSEMKRVNLASLEDYDYYYILFSTSKNPNQRT